MRYDQRKKFADCGHVGTLVVLDRAYWYECTCGHLGDKMRSRKQAEEQAADHALKVWPGISKYFDDKRVGPR